MKKLIYSVLALVVVFSMSSCDQSRLDIPQKGVTSIDSFYQTDEDAESALAAAYARFASTVTSQNGGSIYVPFRAALNNAGDDTFAAGSNFGDNDFMAELDEYRFDSSNAVLQHCYENLFLANYAANLVIDNFKDGLPEGGVTATTKRVVAEARTLRAIIYFYLAALWDTPPVIDHVIAEGLPYNCDKDPDNPMTHDELLLWVAKECEEAAADLDERASTSDKNGAVKATKGVAYAFAGKAYLFAKDYAKAKTALKKVIDSGKYALVPGDKYWQNFHAEGDGNEEKVFETNIQYNPGIGAWGGIIQRSTWMEANIWSWRSVHFVTSPHFKYNGGADGWGGLGVPQWFGDEFFANEGHSYRFDATLKHVDDAIYNMEYMDESINAMSLDEKKASTAIGIKDIDNGLYGQSCWLPFKQILRATDVVASYGNNVRMNNFTIMRYAEVLLLYAEACLQSGDTAGAKDAINKIQQRAGAPVSASVDMNTLKKEKSYELWLEGSRYLDIQRWGDLDRVKKAGQSVPKLFDKLFRAPKSGEKILWEDDRFYCVESHEAIDRNMDVGYKTGKNETYPFPKTVMDKNPNLEQNPGY